LDGLTGANAKPKHFTSWFSEKVNWTEAGWLVWLNIVSVTIVKTKKNYAP
jgi:hypothetical protein